MNQNLILGACLGNCVHVGGVVHFLSLAEDLGYETLFLGPAVSNEEILRAMRKYSPGIVALSYRLTPKNVTSIIEDFRTRCETLPERPLFFFGGTFPVAQAVDALHFFDHVFDGREDLDDCIALLKNRNATTLAPVYPSTLEGRISAKAPYPILRHHFGLPSYQKTLDGISEIAESRVLDVISLGIDQNTQQYFFRPEQRDPALDGAGGVPVRSEEEFIRLKRASECGNRPLMRCYSGTADVLKMGTMLLRTIDNAWCAVPLCWYNELDGRGARKPEASMAEAQSLMRLHSEKGVPVEVNEPHHWGLRDAHDTISVAMAYLSAYQAKKAGVQKYIAQYMFNIPAALSFSMDLAKVLAQIELVESLGDASFSIYREVRAGLPFLSSDTELAKGQLASSTFLSMAVRPHIIHIVGYSEAEHAATPKVVIESAKIVRGVIRSTLSGCPNLALDPTVAVRKQELMEEAWFLLGFIFGHYKERYEDPLNEPAVIADCIRRGILDAPHILKNGEYRGILKTRVIDGKCLAWNPETKQPLCEAERLGLLGEHGLLDARPSDFVPLERELRLPLCEATSAELLRRPANAR